MTESPIELRHEMYPDVRDKDFEAVFFDKDLSRQWVPWIGWQYTDPAIRFAYDEWRRASGSLVETPAPCYPPEEVVRKPRRRWLQRNWAPGFWVGIGWHRRRKAICLAIGPFLLIFNGIIDEDLS